MVAAKDFSAALPRSCASWLDWISNMSLVAACFTKSSVAGLIPSVEFIPVFSPMDWAMAGVVRRTSARHGARCFIFASSSVAGSDPASPVSIGNNPYRSYAGWAAGPASHRNEGVSRTLVWTRLHDGAASAAHLEKHD